MQAIRAELSELQLGYEYSLTLKSACVSLTGTNGTILSGILDFWLFW